MSNETVVQTMKKRGFTCEKVFREECTSFVFTNEEEKKMYDGLVILVEVYPQGRYHFYYTQETMLGYMDSGILEDVFDSYRFNYYYRLFKEQVNAIRGQMLKNEYY